MMLTSDSPPEKSSPYFLSSLSSKSVPENEDATFTCRITGNPKPEITWCRNGRDVKELEDFSNYEIIDDDPIHTLHLFGCTEEQAGVYRIVASNCFGRVQSSAFLKVTPGAKPGVYKTLHDNPKNDVRTCRANDIAAYRRESSHHATGNKEDLVENNDSTHECFLSLGPPEPLAPEFNPSKQTTFSHSVERGICPPLENQGKNIHCLGDSVCAKNVLSPEENNGSILDTAQNTSDLSIYESLEMSRECTEREMSGDSAEREVDTVSSSQVDSKPASQIDDHTDSCSLNAKDLAACQTTEYAKTHEEICLGEVLRNETRPLSHTGTPLENQTCGLEDLYKHADDDSEILPGRTAFTADESPDNDGLEDLKRSNVKTEESGQKWERELKFLLESDDEDELTLGSDCDGCAYFLLGKMPRLCQVSGDTVPMDTTIGFCGHQSKPKEVAVRSDLTTCNPSLFPTGMTLTVGRQQSKAPTTQDKEKCQQPVASMAIENDYPRIEEENNSNGQSAEESSVDRLQSKENELLEMEPSSCGISSSSAATEKPNVERNFSQKNLQKFAKVKEKVTKGRGKGDVAGPTKASKCPLNKLHPKELHAAKSCTIQVERSFLDSAALLHGCNHSQPKEAYRDAAKSSTYYGLLHGKGGDENSPQEGKRISSLSKGNQLPKENGALTAKPQGTEADSPVPIGSELKLFIAEPETDDGFLPPSSPAKNISGPAESPALEEACGKDGIQMDNAVLENSTSLHLPCQTCAIDQQEPSWAEMLQVTTTENTVSQDVLLDTLDHTPSVSHEGCLWDILTPGAVPDRQMDSGMACGTKPHEIAEVKTTYDSLWVEHLSTVDFQTSWECSEPEAKEADLSQMHEQLQKLLHEEEGWGCDFTHAGGEVMSLAAGPDPAKEAEGLSVTGDVSADHPPVPGHLAKDNQLVTELATALETVTKDYMDCDSLLRIDETSSEASVGKSSLALPVETDVPCLSVASGQSTEKPSVPLLRGRLLDAEVYMDNNQKQTPLSDNEPVQMSVSREGKITMDNAFSSRAATSPFGFTEAQDGPLKCGRVMLIERPALYLGQSLYPEQDVRCGDDAVAEQSNEISAKNSHVILCQSRIKDGANLPELSPKEDSPSNFSAQNADQCTSEGRSSVTAVDKSTKETFQENGTELDWNAQSDGNCDIYHVLTGSNSDNFHALSEAENYSYHMQEHNSVIVISSIVDWDGPEDADIKEAMFKASYKGKFQSEVPPGSSKNGGKTINHKRRDCGVHAEQIAPESQNVLEILLPGSQQRISGGKSSITDDVCAIEKGVGMHTAGFTPDSGNTIASIMGNECSSSGQASPGASDIVGLAGSQESSQGDVNEEGTTKALGAESFRAENLMPTESMCSKAEKDVSEQTPQLRQDPYRRVGEEEGIHFVQHERDPEQRERSVFHDCEEAEVEPYMRTLLDSKEQIHSWLDSIELEQKEHRKLEGEKQTQVASCDGRDIREHQPSLECDLEEVEVEPYMRALVTSEEIHSWHESINYLYPSGEQTEGSIGACAATSTSHNQAGAFTADKGKNLNTSERTMEASVNVVPCASEKSKLCKAAWTHSSPEDVKRKQETVKKKVVSKVQGKKPRLEAKENTCSSSSGVRKASKGETGQKEDKRAQRKPPSEKDSKAPKLLKKIQAELFPDFSGNIKLCCQFIEIHEDAIITWTKDSQLLARVQRSAGDEFPVSLAIVQAGKKDQGLYCCCLKNRYGKATADFNLTSEVLEHLSSFQDAEGLEEIEFLQLMFREDFICDSYFSNSLHGRITTEELHFGEGVHRKAFRSKVMQGLVPVFSPGHPCVLKVHNAIAYGTKNNDELIKKNYKLALQECYIQNTAREYAKIYAAETEQLEGFGEVPEIIPIFLIHRPKSNIPYATVEEELIGEFVKYSVKDGKEINFMRRDSEAGQKCCTFQHWVYERTSGSLLITDMQGVGMKLTDVGIATLAKGYKGFKGNCSISFIDQFKAIHQCNKYCEMLGLKPLQTSGQKLRKPAVPKPKTQPPSSSTLKKTGVGAQVAKKT